GDQLNVAFARLLEAVRLPSRVVECHFAQQKSRESWLLCEELVMVTEDGKKILQTGGVFADARFSFPCDFVQIVIGDQKQEVTFVLRVSENRSNPDAGSDRNFACCRFVEPLLHEQLPGRLPD